ncbi:MAG: BlaI/MecI/CopY family transcriptional regulator [Lachnospiraceae bacterium]
MKRKYLRLPDSELDIMLVLWNGHPDMSRSEIEEVVNEKRSLAPTTILSLLSRLEKKKVVSVKKEGKKNLYRALITQEEYQINESSNILDKLYNNSVKNFVVSLYEGKKFSHDELAELKAFIEQVDEEE